MRKVNAQIRKVAAMNEDELMTEAKNLGAPYELLLQIKKMASSQLLTLQLEALRHQQMLR